MLPQGGGSGGGRFGPSIAAQSKYYGLSWNPLSMTSFLFIELQPQVNRIMQDPNIKIIPVI